MFKLCDLMRIQPSILALSLVSLIVMMGSSMVTPSLTLYAKQGLGADELLVGAVIAGFAIGRLVFDIPAGFLADRFGIKKTMILGLGILVGSSILAGFAPSYWILMSARIVEGIGSSIYVSAAIAFVLISSETSRRGANIGTYQSMLMLGPITGPIVGAPIAVIFGYNAPYFAFAGFMLAALFVISILIHRGSLDIRSVISHHSGAVASNQGAFAIYLNTASIATFGFAFLRSGIYTTGMPLFAYGHLALSVFDVGIMLTLASVANLTTSFFSGRITQAYGMKRPLFAAILFSAVLVAIIPLASTMIQLLTIITLLGIASGFFGQSIAWAAEQIENKVGSRNGNQVNRSGQRLQSHVTRGIGFNRMIGDLGLILGPLFVGYLISVLSGSNFAWSIAFGSTSAILGIVCFLILRSEVKCLI